MNADLLKSYWKYRYKTIIIWALFLVASYWVDRNNPGFIIFPLIWGARELYFCKETVEKIRTLKAKGLTEQDLVNIEFVRKWEATRLSGLWKYCLVYGLFIGAFGFSLVISLCYFVIHPAEFKAISASPNEMFRFIGLAYMVGAAIGVIFFRASWYFNQRRFKRLTDPLNTIFNSKRNSFNNPL